MLSPDVSPVSSGCTYSCGLRWSAHFLGRLTGVLSILEETSCQASVHRSLLAGLLVCSKQCVADERADWTCRSSCCYQPSYRSTATT